MLGEFEKRLKEELNSSRPRAYAEDAFNSISKQLSIVIREAKKEFPFTSWLKEDLEELKMSIKRSVKERGHSVLNDEVSKDFIKTLDAIEKWFGS